MRVVGVGLGAEHGDVINVAAELEQFFQGTHPGHAVADHHQLEFFMSLSDQTRANKKGVPASQLARTPLSWSRSLGKHAPSSLKGRLYVGCWES